MFYLQYGSLKLVPASATPDHHVFEYQDIRYLGENRLIENAENNQFKFYIEQEGENVGEISLHNIKWLNRKARVTLFIWPTNQKKGTGRKALIALLDFAFKVMNLYRIEAEIVEGNEASVRLFTSHGFVEEGRLRRAKFLNGSYQDILVFGLLKDEWGSNHQTLSRTK